jgi:hypothetical protein
MILPRVSGVEADMKHLHSPDENKFCSDRHRPANTFPPVLTGLSFFPNRGRSGFTPYTNQRTRRILAWITVSIERSSIALNLAY